MNRSLSLASWLVIAVACALVLPASGLRADTRSDYSIFCLDVFENQSTPFLYPISQIANTGTQPAGGGSFSWDLYSDAVMPAVGFPFLTQSAEATASLQNVPVDFGAGCQFFSGSESRIVIRGRHLMAPGAVGTAAAQIRVQYHVILENEYSGTGASVGSVNGININTASQFDSTAIGLTDSGAEPVLDAPAGASVTDQSVGPLTRKEVQGAVVLNDMLSYGPGMLNQVGITFYSGAQTSSNASTVLVTAHAASLAGDTAVTDVTSLDPNVEFTVVVPEPGGAALGLAAAATLALRARRA